MAERRQRLVKRSYQLTEAHIAYLEERRARLGLVSEVEALRDALNALMVLEPRTERTPEELAAQEIEGPNDGGAI